MYFRLSFLILSLALLASCSSKEIQSEFDRGEAVEADFETDSGLLGITGDTSGPAEPHNRNWIK